MSIRFVVTALFAWALIQATFANTVTWRHPHTELGTTVRQDSSRPTLAKQRSLSERSARVAKNI